ncbi:hypothetical protein ACTXT7_007680 [Hymenolepis weldensis]
MVKVNSKKIYGKWWLRQPNPKLKGVSGLSGSSWLKQPKISTPVAVSVYSHLKANRAKSVMCEPVKRMPMFAETKGILFLHRWNRCSSGTLINTNVIFKVDAKAMHPPVQSM